MLVAVIVPNEEVVNKWAYTNGHISSFPKLCSLDQLNKYVLSELKLTAERNKVTLYCIWNEKTTFKFYFIFWTLHKMQTMIL